MGAWIETLVLLLKHFLNRSHPSWVRGLKQIWILNLYLKILVAPLVGAWIETIWNEQDAEYNASHPSWVRGLKLTIVRLLRTFHLSHPSWVRGLKLLSNIVRLSILMSHPSWVRGLKLCPVDVIMLIRCRTPRGCVD